MNNKDDNNLKPTTPWYQNVTITVSWIWAGINLLPIFLSGLSNLDILSKWITWPVTIIGSIIVGVIMLGSPIYLNYFKVKWKHSETGRNRRVKSFDSRTIFTGLGVLIALWIPRIGELYIPNKSGDIRIAVADFIVLDKNLPSSLGQELSQQVYDSIQQNINEVKNDYGVVNMEVLPPNRTPSISGVTPDQIANSVENISRKTEADIIVYAIITKGTSDNSAEVVPFFFLAENSVLGFPEFVGQDAWTSKFTYLYDNSIDSNFQRDNLTESLSQRTKAFTYSIYGAWKYNLGDYKTSYELLQKAAEGSSLEDKKGRSVWYLWWGNAALKLGDYENAYKYYQAALDYRPGYARAYIGLANTTISQANYLISTSGLSNVQDFVNTTNIFLDNARNASDRPSSADIDMKAELVLGKIAQMESFYYAKPDLLNEAEMHYKNIITDYADNKNKRIKEHAGLAYMHLGEIEMEKQQSNSSSPDFSLASSYFNSALEILRDQHAIELTRSNLAKLPVLSPIQAQAQLATAIAISNDDGTKSDYQNRIECWKVFPTPIPQDKLICP